MKNLVFARRTVFSSLVAASLALLLVGCGTCPGGGNACQRPVIIVNPAGPQPRNLSLLPERPTLIIDLSPTDRTTLEADPPDGYGVPEPDASIGTNHPGTRPIVLITNHPGTRPIVLKTDPMEPAQAAGPRSAASQAIVIRLPRCYPAYDNGLPVRVKYKHGKPYVVPPAISVGMEPPGTRHPGTRPVNGE